MSTSALKSTVNYLDSERQNASFNVRNLTYILDGGEEKTKKKELIRTEVEKDPVFRKEEKYFLSRSEEYKRGLEKNIQTIKRVVELGLTKDDDARLFYDVLGELMPISGLHHGMFIPTLQSQGNQEQRDKWLGDAMMYNIIGTYAQTELGHGSFLRGIETTATYDLKTQEFVLCTPTTTSMKWWPGGLGKACTHCVLMARLIIEGKDYGVHPFIVQLRSLENHVPLPGVTLGDIGPKFAWNSIDNGFLKLDNVRIPRDQMLMKFAKVSPTGEYTKPPHSKIAYGTMIYVRAGMIQQAALQLSKAVTIAIRYSAVRRQGYLMGTKNQTGEEMKVIDFGTQQFALFPLLAGAYALHFTGQYMLILFKEVSQKVATGDFAELPELHATSAGLKSFSTWMASEGCEECRQRCGGHGFLRTSGLPDLYAATVPACTYEGDNNVLLQQTARYLLKALKSASTGKMKLTGNITYLNGIKNLGEDKCGVKTEQDLLDPEVQLAIYKHKAARLIATMAKRVENELKTGKEFPQVWNSVMSDFKPMIKAHCYLIMVQSFQKAVASIQDKSVQAVLKKLCDFFALYHLEQDVSTVLIDRYFNSHQVFLLNKQVKELMGQIRKDAVPLVDAFNFSDFSLNSALGRADGNVYEALHKFALMEPLNKSDVVEGYKEYIRPLITKSNL